MREEKRTKIIRKKILPKYFLAVELGYKNFELRKDEDDIQVGDDIILCEWEEDKGYSGASIRKTVKYVSRNVPEYGLMEGYCIIGF